MESNAQTLPVFILENEIKFIINRPETHRHILTIYNPYEFGLKFKVLSSAPNEVYRFKVTVISEFIRPKCYVEIIIEYVSPNPGDIGRIEYLRVDIFRENELCGQKSIKLVYMAEESILRSKSSHYEPDLQQKMTNSTTSLKKTSFSRSIDSNIPTNQREKNEEFNLKEYSWLAVIFFVICVIIVIFPTSYINSTENQTPSYFDTLIPTYLWPSVTHRLVCAFACGFFAFYFFARN